MSNAKEENKENQVPSLIQQKDDSDEVSVKSSKKSLFESNILVRISFNRRKLLSYRKENTLQ
jgi:hypothetical protein